MRRAKHVVRLHHHNADAACFARIGEAAAAAAAGSSRGVCPQLPRGNCPGAHSRHNDRRQERGFDFFPHDRSPFLFQAEPPPGAFLS